MDMPSKVRVQFVDGVTHQEYPDHKVEFIGNWVILRPLGSLGVLVAWPSSRIKQVDQVNEREAT